MTDEGLFDTGKARKDAALFGTAKPINDSEAIRHGEGYE
ncbi:unnamed protein product [Ixodes persulcatus]